MIERGIGTMKSNTLKAIVSAGVLGMAVAAALLATLTASAQGDAVKVGGIALSAPARMITITVADRPGYKGFVTVYQTRDCSTAFAADFAPSCTIRPEIAWRWNGSAWRSVEVQVGTRMYAWPFSGSWSWAYDYQRREWLAMRGSQLLIRYDGGMVVT